MTAALLRLRGVGKRFGAVRALDGVDLEVAQGGALAVVGPNGAGKSTLLRIMSGLVHPTTGRVDVAGHDTPRSAVGYLGHATLLYPELTARENLIFAGRLQQVASPGARADLLLEQEGLAEVAERPAGGFSRGMAQRLSIARARVHDPALLLLDEPYTGLDRRSAERLTTRLAALRRDSGHGLVLVTHDVRQAAELADEVAILMAGRVVRRSRGDDLDPEGLDALYAQLLEESAASGERRASTAAGDAAGTGRGTTG